MPEPSGQRPGRAKVRAPRRSPRAKSVPPRNARPSGIRERLKRDPFLFLMCLGALAFMTWAFALTWWVTGGVVLLALALASVAPAFFLFYLRDA
jgi:Flp pilus assembly protein TadB